MKQLDLHGVRHKDVQNRLETFLLDGTKSYLDSQIITGNSPEMQRIVMEFLEEHDFDYLITSWHMGRITIVG